MQNMHTFHSWQTRLEYNVLREPPCRNIPTHPLSTHLCEPMGWKWGGVGGRGRSDYDWVSKHRLRVWVLETVAASASQGGEWFPFR